MTLSPSRSLACRAEGARVQEFAQANSCSAKVIQTQEVVEDPVLWLADTNSNAADDRLKSYADALRLHWPLTTRELDTYKYQLRLSYAQKWAEQKWQGQGVEEFAQDPVGNSWLQRYDLLPASRYIDAIKLRTNTYPTRALMKIIDGRVDSSCRKCQGSSETLGHILGRCRYTKDKRISRHNEIKDLLKARLAKNHQVMDEPQITVRGQSGRESRHRATSAAAPE
ncbi:uncharacterized protein LOC116417835 [Nasonia vitripennis]|uniref:Reverse transcriptase n=1 Tax=Nasonia vitripennis TaxID=7425 RepID=A0A7M7TB89_NASVI|nr:uncharacterized protein LOC116417835 [Nasonia vitripennis]